MIKRFDGVDFDFWKFKMQAILQGRDLWDFVKADENAVTSINNLDARADEALRTVILHLSNAERKRVKSDETARAMWKALVDGRAPTQGN